MVEQGKCIYCNQIGKQRPKYNNIILCNKHMHHMRRFGEIRNTKYDPNPINIYEDKNIIGIITLDSNYQVTGEYFIDKEDYDNIPDIRNIRWRKGSDNRIVNNSNKTIYLHNIILQHYFNNDGLVGDHIDGDVFNCCKSNLRPITFHENCYNHKIRLTNTSGITGVGYSKTLQQWRARIGYDNKEIVLGYSSDFNEVAKLRLQGEIKYYGKLSRNYNADNDRWEIKYLNPDDKKYYLISGVDQIVLENFMEVNEISYEELMEIPSTRGVGALGSSGK